MAEINLTVRVHDILKDRFGKDRNFSDGVLNVSVPQNTRIIDLLIHLGLTDDWVGLVTVNKRQSGPEKMLEDGDYIELFSPLVGG